jgi:bacterioferritin (cytochrome b1)
MNYEKMHELLNEDLKNEWKHLRFYLHHASSVVGLHREEFKEVLLKQAASEMTHVTQFSDLIIGIGGNPTCDSNDFEKFENVAHILKYALDMEEEVVSRYVARIEDAKNLLSEVDARWLEIFLEKQIEHSREDADEFRQMLKGI